MDIEMSTTHIGKCAVRTKVGTVTEQTQSVEGQQAADMVAAQT